MLLALPRDPCPPWQPSEAALLDNVWVGMSWQ